MSKQLNEDTSFKVSIKNLIGIGFAMVTVISIGFIVQADIEEANKFPAPLPRCRTRTRYAMQGDRSRAK